MKFLYTFVFALGGYALHAPLSNLSKDYKVTDGILPIPSTLISTFPYFFSER